MKKDYQSIFEACEFELVDFSRALRRIARNHHAADIREANEARKACMAALQYEGLSARQARTIILQIEKGFGLI